MPKREATAASAGMPERECMDILDLLVSSGILGALLVLLLKGIQYLGSWLELKNKELTHAIENTQLKNVIDLTMQTVWNVVNQLSQELVDDMRKKAADGKLNEDEIRLLKTEAVLRIKSIIGDSAVTILKGTFGNAEEWLISLIDAYVRQEKKAPTVTK